MSSRRGVCVLLALTLLMACGSDAPTASTVGATKAAADPAATTADPADPVRQSDEVALEPAAASPTATATETDAAAPAPSATSAAGTGVDATTTTTTEDTDPMAPTPTTPPAGNATPAGSNTQPELDCIRLTDFALDAENFGWFIVNDNVMGGRSSGGPVFENSAMIFEGEINTNGGGFSSVRAEIAPTTLAGYTHLIVRARTDERTYKVTLEDALETRDRRISQQQTLEFGDPDDDGWQTARVDFDRLDPRIFGRAVDSESFRPDLATQLGVMISDGVDGPFRIEVDWIDACR